LAWLISRGIWGVLRYDGAITMARTQVTLEGEIQRRARRRANDLGISFAEYVRRLVARDLEVPQIKADPSAVFDLGRSDGSDIAKHKDQMIAEAFLSTHQKGHAR
jgi:hypothetical protein